jgi:AcrR family transcriptional regulator
LVQSPNSRPGQLGGPRQLRRRARVSTIGGAALGGFLTRGLESTTVSWIIEQSGCGKSSFYRYFASKEAVVQLLVDPLMVGLAEAYETCDLELGSASNRGEIFAAYETLGINVGELVLSHPQLVRLYLQEARGPDTGARRPIRALARMIEKGAMVLTATARAKDIIRPFSPEVSALAVIGACERLILAVLEGEMTTNPGEIPSQLIDLFLAGLIPEENETRD